MRRVWDLFCAVGAVVCYAFQAGREERETRKALCADGWSDEAIDAYLRGELP